MKNCTPSPLVESLESRKLFAATAVLVNGTLTITGTDSNDTIELSKDNSNLKVKLNGSTKTFTYNNVSKILANLKKGDDKFTSSTAVKRNMEVHGGDGKDTIRTGGGNDKLFGDAQNDTLDGRTGDDDMRGGSGTDTADFSDRTYDLTITIDNAPNDGQTGSGKDNVRNDIENIKGGKGDDYIQGSDYNNEIWGNDGEDTIYSVGGNDKVHGGAQNDYIYAGEGKDSVWGDSGKDILSGGDNADKIHAKDGQKDQIFQAAGDTIEKDGIDEVV